jgi:Skp family chaperone for outer membrane proteins
MNPDFHERTRKYLSPYDTDLFDKVRNSPDVRLKYTIYKTNADFLLISIGIFRNPDGSRPGTKDAFMKDNEEVYVGRAKAYYQFAYSYSQSMFRKATAISEVLEKLSRGFEQYVDILSYMRGEYFNILERLSSGDVYHLERAIDRAESDRELRALQDQFLDMYSEYMKTNKAELKEQLRELAKKIQRIDESFRFTMDQI